MVAAPVRWHAVGGIGAETEVGGQDVAGLVEDEDGSAMLILDDVGDGSRLDVAVAAAVTGDRHVDFQVCDCQRLVVQWAVRWQVAGCREDTSQLRQQHADDQWCLVLVKLGDVDIQTVGIAVVVAEDAVDAGHGGCDGIDAIDADVGRVGRTVDLDALDGLGAPGVVAATAWDHDGEARNWLTAAGVVVSERVTDRDWLEVAAYFLSEQHHGGDLHALVVVIVDDLQLVAVAVRLDFLDAGDVPGHLLEDLDRQVA